MKTIKVKVTYIEIVYDNYQGCSGLPVQRTDYIDMQEDDPIKIIEDIVVETLYERGHRSSFNPKDRYFSLSNVISIEILPNY